MPLRDHFRPPLDLRTSWEGFHGGWPAMMVRRLNAFLPSRYVAGPRVCRGAEVVSGTFEQEEADISAVVDGKRANWILPAPTVAFETDLLSSDEYEVRVFDVEHSRRLVVVVEIVSPANKDRPEHRQAFVGKCEALLRQGVSVAVVDLVTTRHFNLYTDLLNLIGRSDPLLSAAPPGTYAAACRWIERGRKHMLETWAHTLTLGQPLPTLPLWLAENSVVPLELEASYEETCRALRMV